MFLRWKGMESAEEGDFFVRSGPGTVKLPPESAERYVETRFGVQQHASPRNVGSQQDNDPSEPALSRVLGEGTEK